VNSTEEVNSEILTSEHVSKIEIQENPIQVYLTNDEILSRQRYSQQTDINGRYLVKNQDGTNSDLDADYCIVHFSLPYPAPETNGNLYVLGGFTDWHCNRQNQMKYNYEKRIYECAVFLKQGYYNYEYAILSDNSSIPDEALTEGSHHETENEYTILIYCRPAATYYDKLLAVKRVNTTRN